MRILVDADYIVYAAGFVCRHNRYTVVTGKGDKAMMLGEFKGKREATAALKAAGVDGDIYQSQEMEPLSHALFTAKRMMEKLRDKIEKKFDQFVELEVYLTGDGNFRDRLATIKPYKGNRQAVEVPYKADLQKYMVDRWDAVYVHGMEADDAVAMRQTELAGDSIIVTRDKDLLQVPGWHYNPDKGFVKVSKKLGELLLYRQIISGDATDNIMGCYRIGVGKAKDILPVWSECMEEVTINTFANNMARYPEQYPENMTAIEAFKETAQLVYMRRSVNDTRFQ